MLPQINILIKKGEKSQARVMVNDALVRIEKIESYQKQLMQLSESIDEETLLLSQTQDTKQYLLNKANQLRNAITVYINCDAKLFEGNYSALEGEIQGELSKHGVAFVDDAQQADWAIYIQAKAREYNKSDINGLYTYYTYVDANISISKPLVNKLIYEDMINEKGGHTANYEQAARGAYKHLAPRLSAVIKEQIEK